MLETDATKNGEQFSVYSIKEITHPKTEKDLALEVLVDGQALAGFIVRLLEIRQEQEANESEVESDGADQDDDFVMEVIGEGFSEVGGLPVSRSGINDSLKKSSVSIDQSMMLNSSGKSTTWIEMSSFDIQKAMEMGNVSGWIHSQPGGTAPSVKSGENPSDERVSRMISKFTNCSSHIAFIVDRYGKKITAYLYNSDADLASGEEYFTRIKGLKIKIPSNMDTELKSHLLNLQYTDV